VPSKLVDSDYGVTNGKKNKRSKKKKNLNVVNVSNVGSESIHDVNWGKVDECQTGVNYVPEVRNSCTAGKEGMGNEEDETVANQGINIQDAGKEGIKVSYANIASSNGLDNKLELIPTEINEEGIEVVIFDEEIVNEGSKKWELTVCGIQNFKSSEGIQSVIEIGPWMVNGKPMFVQKWDPSVSLDKAEPKNSLYGLDSGIYLWKHGPQKAKLLKQLPRSEKGLPGKIEIVYKNRDGLVTAKKWVDVKYDWSPPVSTFGKVFGHCDKNCVARPKTVEEFMEIKREELKKKKEQVRYKKRGGKKVNQNVGNKNDNKGANSNRVYYKPVEKEGTKDRESIVKEVENEQMIDKGSPKKGWNVQQDIINSIRKSANKYAMLEEENVNERGSEDEIEMEKENIEVYDETSGSAKKMAQNDITSSYNAVKNLIADENIKYLCYSRNKVKKISDRRFGRWNWYDNAIDCSRGCRILIGWDIEKINCMIVHASDQAVLGRLRKKLWSDLNNYKSMINDRTWIIMGDLNVSLNLEDHSEGISCMTQDMEEFKECINDIKMEDICSSGLHYTWIKSFLNPNAILKCPESIKAKSRSSRFANYIADKDGFLDVVKDKWKTDVEGFHMYKLVKKLKAIKPVMKNLNWKNRNLFDNVKKLKKELDEIQTKIDADPTNTHIREQGVNLFKEYTLALEDEEKLLLQKTKVEWLKEGDRNTAYFHKVLKSRSNRCRVEEICDENGVRYTGDQGPNGFTAKFFKKAWNVIGDDVCKAVTEFFLKGKLLGELNATLINLVPKISTPNKVSDFRPIACCNVVYKCISKVITNRVKNALDSIVNKNQSAFIPERQITDNILLTQELLKGYDCVKGPKRCSMKIDIQKAYDTVNFGKSFKNVWFSFKDGPMGYDLFMEVFNLILQQEILRNGRFKYHHGCKDLGITDLCFADDILVLCHGDVNSVTVIKKALEKFSVVSWLYPNLGKSTIFCESMDRVTIESILQILPFKRGKLPDWKNKSLSYAGRTQLIASVLSSIQWRIAEGKSQNSLCQPKQNGGLGLKPLDSWNNALLLKHLWNVANKKRLYGLLIKKDSLWVKWISTVKLKDRSVWEVEKHNNDSWIWRSLLDLRDVARANIIYKIGNGKKASVWHDRWSDMPSLDTIIMSRREIYSVGFSDTVSKCINGNQWTWPNEWVLKYPILNQFPVPNINDDVEDKLVIWFSQNIPRQAFVLWMAIKKKLVTQDKLAIWYPGKIWKCLLCMLTEDSRNHLFFECEYSKEVWNNMQTMINTKDLKTLDSSMLNFSNMPCTNSIWSIVRRLTIASTVYHIWKERNSRVFQKKERRPEILYQVIRDNVKCRLLSLKVTNSKAVKAVEEVWKVTMNIK
ncbi:RNA-directed DNA polymerase, eukaryota, reverse transcriptase zinc-binding domain protein, partial [Tanacetum coccineum]